MAITPTFEPISAEQRRLDPKGPEYTVNFGIWGECGIIGKNIRGVYMYWHHTQFVGLNTRHLVAIANKLNELNAARPTPPPVGVYPEQGAG